MSINIYISQDFCLKDRLIILCKRLYKNLLILSTSGKNGTPDFLFINPTEKYNGLHIYLNKSKLNEKQLEKSENINIKVIVSDNYDYISYKIARYSLHCLK